MAKIESIGTYQFEILESGITLTQTGKPQWCARLKAVKKFVESDSEIKHFQGQGLLADGQPAYVDWNFDEEIVAFMLLFNSADTFDEQTAMKNYEQLQLATGWDGASFDDFGKFVKHVILGRVQEKKPYTNAAGKVVEGGLEVGWIDNKDASPERQLKVLDAADLKSLSAKIKMGPKAKPAVAAKPPASKLGVQVAPATTATIPASVVGSGAPKVGTAPIAVATTAAPSPQATVVEPKAPKAPKQKKAEPTPAPAAPLPPAAEKAIGPGETTMEDAWAAVCSSKGDNEDQVVEEAWISATGEVGGDKDQDQFTPKDWARVRDIVVKDLAA